MTIFRPFLAAAPALVSALTCFAIAFVPQEFPENAGQWAVSLHFAQPPLALVSLVYAGCLDSSLSTARRLLVFFGSLAILGLIGVVTLRDILLDPIVATALAWGMVGHAVGLFMPGQHVASEAARVNALAKDGWELWALVSMAGVVLAGIIAFSVPEARREWAALIPAAYFLVMAFAFLHVHGPDFAHEPRGLSDSRLVRWLWSVFPRSRSHDDL